MIDNTPNKTPNKLINLRRRTVISLLRAWREVKGTARQVMAPEVAPSLPKEDLQPLRKQMQGCLEARGGEITARAHTAELGRTYLGLNAEGRDRFLRLLASDFGVERKKLDKAALAYQEAQNGDEKFKAENALREALITPRSAILRQFTALPDGFKFLVDMRADLLPLVGKDTGLKGLEADMKAVLSAWFDIGLLDMVEITWKSPAALLEKLFEYEAVHAIKSWDDLKNRLDEDRRIYAFFHSKMPMEPLIFVQVALVKGLAGSIQELLDEESPVFDSDQADTAIFYSISNAQKGLAGISFGNFLIKRVVTELMKELSQLKHFATLSPVPGFRAWLDPLLAKNDSSLLQPADARSILNLHPAENANTALLALLAGPWHKDAASRTALKPILLRLAAHYLAEEKKGGKPLDPVANFHLFNGARLERLNWLADISAKGMKQSAGLMVNYYYKLDEIDENHEEFMDGKITASKQVRGYL